MPCTRPDPCWFHVDGGRPVYGHHPDPGSPDWTEGQTPCRRCASCHERYCREWGIRCAHEAQMHKRNSFLTLTYSPRFMPERGMLSRRDLRRFIDRLRKFHLREFAPSHPEASDGFAYYGVGEYGERSGRAHYHVLAFGADFDDRRFYRKSASGYPVWESSRLQELWPFGLATFGEVTCETAFYCASYSMKKLNAAGEVVDPAADWVPKRERDWRVDPVTGQRYRWQSEFSSKSGNLGASWLQRYDSDVFRCDDDYVILRDGRKVPTPEFYLRRLRSWSEDDWLAAKERRKAAMEDRMEDLMPERLAVTDAVVRARQRNALREGV